MYKTCASLCFVFRRDNVYSNPFSFILCLESFQYNIYQLYVPVGSLERSFFNFECDECLLVFHNHTTLKRLKNGAPVSVQEMDFSFFSTKKSLHLWSRFIALLLWNFIKRFGNNLHTAVSIPWPLRTYTLSDNRSKGLFMITQPYDFYNDWRVNCSRKRIVIAHQNETHRFTLSCSVFYLSYILRAVDISRSRPKTCVWVVSAPYSIPGLQRCFWNVSDHLTQSILKIPGGSMFW